MHELCCGQTRRLYSGRSYDQIVVIAPRSGRTKAVVSTECSICSRPVETGDPGPLVRGVKPKVKRPGPWEQPTVCRCVAQAHTFNSFHKGIRYGTAKTSTKSTKYIRPHETRLVQSARRRNPERTKDRLHAGRALTRPRGCGPRRTLWTSAGSLRYRAAGLRRPTNWAP